jgi:hypothetical protein
MGASTPGRGRARVLCVSGSSPADPPTTVDGIGVRLSGRTFGYTGWLMLTETAVVPAVAGTRVAGAPWPELLRDSRSIRALAWAFVRSIVRASGYMA